MALALQHVDLHAGLHGAGRGKDLALAGGDHAVAGDEGGGHAAQRLNGQRQRGDIHQHKALRGRAGGTGQLSAALQQTALHGGTHGHAFIGVQGMAGLTAQQLPDLPLHSGHPGAAAHQQDFAQLAGGNPGIPQGVLHRLNGAGQQVTGHHLKLGAAQAQIQMVRAILAHRDKRQVQLGGKRTGKLLLCLFRFLLQAAHGGGVLGQIDAVRSAELRHSPLNDALVKVIAAQMGIAAGGQHRKGAVLDFNDRNIKGAAAQIIDQDLLGGFVVQAVGHRGGGGLVDDAQNIQARNAARVLSGLALAVVKIGRHGDDRLGHRFAQVALGIAADLGQDHGADLLRGQVSAIDMHPVIRTHVPLDAGHRAA